jgi:hypothetical protein
MGTIYLINEQGSDNYKIGMTKSNEAKRKKSLQTGNSSILETIYTFKTEYPFRIETMLHNALANKRGNGEWFELTEEEVLNFIPLCEKKEKQLKFLMENNHFFKKQNIK